MATSDGSNKHRGRRSRPVVEALEGRALLTAGLKPPALQPVGSGKEFDYTTPTGASVTISLYGAGSLSGTSVDSTGALNLVISGTNEQTGVIGKVHGGGGIASLASIEYNGVSPATLTGIGGSLINIVNLKGFNLVSGGKINLTAGVHTLFLNSVAANTQVNLRELPESLPSSASATVLSSGLTEGSATYNMNGQTVSYFTAANGAQTVTGVSGAFTAGSNLPPITGGQTANPIRQPAPPGMVVTITDVKGQARPVGGLGDPQLFGYDPTANTLVRFDVTTGQPTLTIANALPTGGVEAGVALAKDGTQNVVLISNGTNVYAYDPNSGAPAGSFATTNLAADGLPNPTRLGAAGAATVIADATAGGNGVIQPINVMKSLSSHQAVPVGSAYASQNGFVLSGGLSGVSSSDTLFAVGAATFDRYQPFEFQLGITALSISPKSGAIAEITRGGLTNQGQPIPTDSTAATLTSLSDAVGSVGQNLAVVTSTSGASNTVTLYSPTSLASVGTFTLFDSDRLSGLSSSLYPALAGAALIDIQGNVQSFRTQISQGLVLNDNGNLNLARIPNAADTTIIAYPFSHAEIPVRSNVTILSSGRNVGTRNGVTVENITPTGPLSLP